MLIKPTIISFLSFYRNKTPGDDDVQLIAARIQLNEERTEANTASERNRYDTHHYNTSAKAGRRKSFPSKG